MCSLARERSHVWSYNVLTLSLEDSTHFNHYGPYNVHINPIYQNPIFSGVMAAPSDRFPSDLALNDQWPTSLAIMMSYSDIPVPFRPQIPVV